MDMELLLALQDARESAHPIIEQFLLGVSFIGNGPALIALVLVMYWCVDKKSGLFAVFGFCIASFIGQFVKIVACIYRPWILDERIVPSPGALDGATGYSFPSGHTVGTGAVMGSIAWLLRRKHRIAAVLCCSFIALMMLSRTMLGVHTPQDVLGGLIVAIIGVALSNAFVSAIDRADTNRPGGRHDIAVTAIAFAICIAAIAFALTKPYPMQYVEGSLLVNPEIMMKDFLQTAGIVMGVALGWLLERRLVAFSTQSLTARQRVMRALVGIVIVGASFALADIAFKAILPYNWAKLCSLFVLSVSAMLGAPAAFQHLEKHACGDADGPSI